MTVSLSRRRVLFLTASAAALAALPSCARPVSSSASGKPKVIAVESFLADIAQNVAGGRLTVDTLIPLGVDPHGFEPTPDDAARVASADLVIVNGAGLESSFLQKLLTGAGGRRLVIEASAGLEPRSAKDEGAPTGAADRDHEEDPHFWLDPILVIRYCENIAAGLAKVDPAGDEAYRANAQAYATRLRELDDWAQQQVKAIPPERRLLVTNHESFGYFADRYGFTIVGAVIPSVSSGASPSAQQMAQLVEHIKATGAPAIFLETGSNPQLARQCGIAIYEAEMNLIIHTTHGGIIRVQIEPHRILMQTTDDGPGIADVEKALTPGWSTATQEVRDLGFGAGMGLVNIRRCVDKMDLESTPGKGTKLLMEIVLRPEERFKETDDPETAL